MMPIPVNPPGLAAGLVKVIVRVVVPLSGMLFGLKAFVTVGGAKTLIVSVAVPPVPPSVDEIVPVVLT